MATRPWTRTPIAPEEGVGMVYRRGAYRVQRLGRGFGWTVWCGHDFVATTPKLATGKVLAERHEAEHSYTMRAYRAPFTGVTFNHIMPPTPRYTMCRAVTGGPGSPLDLAEVDCRACLAAYTEAQRLIAKETA